MEKTNLCEGVIAQMMEEEAWKNISSSFPFTQEQLEKHADKVDWEGVSENCEIYWSAQMLEKFKNRVHWDMLASNFDPDRMPEDILSKFKERWDWDEFSENGCFTEAIIEKYADLLNWKKLINNYHMMRSDELNLTEFVEKYQDRIPGSEFKDSRLWNELVSEREKAIRRNICLNQI